MTFCRCIGGNLKQVSYSKARRFGYRPQMPSDDILNLVLVDSTTRMLGQIEKQTEQIKYK